VLLPIPSVICVVLHGSRDDRLTARNLNHYAMNSCPWEKLGGTLPHRSLYSEASKIPKPIVIQRRRFYSATNHVTKVSGSDHAWCSKTSKYGGSDLFTPQSTPVTNSHSWISKRYTASLTMDPINIDICHSRDTSN
jgi:hypothetical protein